MGEYFRPRAGGGPQLTLAQRMEDKMKADGLNLSLRNVPSGILAVFTLIVATIVLFGVGESIQQFDGVGHTAYILNDLVIALGCFFIIRANPKSLWYVPLICNAISIIAAFVEPNFWQTSSRPENTGRIL